MDRSVLTADDLAWLAKHAEACRKRCDLILYNLRKKNSDLDQAYAGSVPIWFGGDFVQATYVLQAIEKKVPHSQIFEQWESRVYQDVIRACATLSEFDASVLLMASGFHLTTEEAIYAAADEAVGEAYEELYGSDEDHC